MKKEEFRRNKDEIFRLIDEGYSMTEVARLYKVHRNTMRKYVSELSET